MTSHPRQKGMYLGLAVYLSFARVWGGANFDLQPKALTVRVLTEGHGTDHLDGACNATGRKLAEAFCSGSLLRTPCTMTP